MANLTAMKRIPRFHPSARETCKLEKGEERVTHDSNQGDRLFI